MLFEWDKDKAEENFRKHGVTFDAASTVFNDPLELTIHDPLHSQREDRFISIGLSHGQKLLVVIYTERGNKIRLISARKASKHEKNNYEKNT